MLDPVEWQPDSGHALEEIRAGVAPVRAAGIPTQRHGLEPLKTTLAANFA